MVIDTFIIYESLEGLSCYNIIGGVGVPVSLRHNGLSMVRLRGSSLLVKYHTQVYYYCIYHTYNNFQQVKCHT